MIYNKNNDTVTSKYGYHLNFKMEKEGSLEAGRHIYLVDDDIDDLAVSKQALARSNRVGDICVVGTADKLFEQMREHGHFNDMAHSPALLPVILMDIHMPTISGIEMLELIRDHPMTCDLPVILLTTDMSGQRIHDAYRLRANGYLKKPFDTLKFHNILDNIETGGSPLQVDEDYIA